MPRSTHYCRRRRLDHFDPWIRNTDLKPAIRLHQQELALRKGNSCMPGLPVHRNIRRHTDARAACLDNFDAKETFENGVLVRARRAHERVPAFAHTFRCRQFLNEPRVLRVFECVGETFEQMDCARNITIEKTRPGFNGIPPRPHLEIVVVVRVDMSHWRGDRDRPGSPPICLPYGCDRALHAILWCDTA